MVASINASYKYELNLLVQILGVQNNACACLFIIEPGESHTATLCNLIGIKKIQKLTKLYETHPFLLNHDL